MAGGTPPPYASRRVGHPLCWGTLANCGSFTSFRMTNVWSSTRHSLCLRLRSGDNNVWWLSRRGAVRFSVGGRFVPSGWLGKHPHPTLRVEWGTRFVGAACELQVLHFVQDDSVRWLSGAVRFSVEVASLLLDGLGTPHLYASRRVGHPLWLGTACELRVLHFVLDDSVRWCDAFAASVEVASFLLDGWGNTPTLRFA
jgi:hypothetical protein